MTRASGFDPSTGICWQFRHPGEQAFRWKTQHERTCPVCSLKFDERGSAMFGRCRSGQRWFWTGFLLHEEERRSGFADSEEEAIAAVRAALCEMKTRPLMFADFSAGLASEALKRINAEKRRLRPEADGSEAKTVEYLYAHEYCWNDGYLCPCQSLGGEDRVLYHTVKFQIVRKTKQRIYYCKDRSDLLEKGFWRSNHRGTGYVGRQKIEADGSVWDLRGRYGRHDLYLSLEHLLGDCLKWMHVPDTPNLLELKAEMAAAHPDRGGSNQAFIAARARYVAARRLARDTR